MTHVPAHLVLAHGEALLRFLDAKDPDQKRAAKAQLMHLEQTNRALQPTHFAPLDGNAQDLAR